jgi:hypothetical protein
MASLQKKINFWVLSFPAEAVFPSLLVSAPFHGVKLSVILSETGV